MSCRPTLLVAEVARAVESARDEVPLTEDFTHKKPQKKKTLKLKLFKIREEESIIETNEYND